MFERENDDKYQTETDLKEAVGAVIKRRQSAAISGGKKCEKIKKQHKIK